MIWAILLLSLTIAFADVWFYRRHATEWPRWQRILFICATILSDLIPLMLMGLFKILNDNDSWVISLTMWAFFAYIILIVPRATYYLFHRLRIPRVGMVIAIALVMGLIWGATEGRTRYRISEVEVQLDNLPPSFDGLRIVQFSDLHIGTLICPDHELERLVSHINALHPDLVVFNGDLINIRYTELDSTAMRILGGIKAPFGVISNLGNHDTGLYVYDTVSLPVAVNTERLIERQRAMGWRLPDDATEYLVRGGDSISVSGISFDPIFREARHDRNIDFDLSRVYEGVSPDMCNITVSHLPQLWETILGMGYGDLTLSGHVHAMQISLNLGAWRLSPAQLVYDRWSGLYEEENSTLYINDGTGYVGFPMRLGAYPEITLITLRQ